MNNVIERLKMKIEHSKEYAGTENPFCTLAIGKGNK